MQASSHPTATNATLENSTTTNDASASSVQKQSTRVKKATKKRPAVHPKLEALSEFSDKLFGQNKPKWFTQLDDKYKVRFLLVFLF